MNACRAIDDLTSWTNKSPSLSAARRLVVVLIERFDQRAIYPIERSWHVPAAERRALHVATDKTDQWALAEAWMAADLRMPLQIIDNADSGIGPAVLSLVEYELSSGFDEAIILIGRIALRRRWHHLLHDRKADEIILVLSDIPCVTVATANVGALTNQ